MDFLDLAKARYSCRKFTSEKVSGELLDKLLNAANLAPTAKNSQPIEIIVIESQEALERLKSCTPCHFDAPLSILVCYDKTKCWIRPDDNQDSGFVDGAIVLSHIMLEATDLGLGSTWVMKFNPELVYKEFVNNENLVPVGFLMIGHPDKLGIPSERHFIRDNMIIKKV